MIYPKELFDLNFAFVFKVAALLGKPWQDLLLCYTHTFRRFRLGAILDPLNPIWLQFLEGIHQVDDPAAYAYQFHLMRERTAGPLHRGRLFGCFSYTLEQESNRAVLRIHFANHNPGNPGPLSPAGLPARLEELTEMFRHARKQVSLPCRVEGRSWLYNLPGYRYLFPANYIDTLAPSLPDYPVLALWGQFLDHRLQVRNELSDVFLIRITQARAIEDLQQAFPYRMLAARADIEQFYAFYGLGSA